MAHKLSLNVTERMYIGSDDNHRNINYVEANIVIVRIQSSKSVEIYIPGQPMLIISAKKFLQL